MNYPLRNSLLHTRLGLRACLAGLTLIIFLLFATPVQAATLCVDKHNLPGCMSTISAAVEAAAAGDTIKVGPGTFREDVVIGKPLSLIGSGRDQTIIDATGLANGVYVDGYDNGGVAEVAVSGFTIRNANFEGILVEEGDAISIWGNVVRGNDRSLQAANAACPGLPVFETNEGQDCGEGIHLIGTVHSTVSDNLVEQNSGGILVTDETTTSHDNVITRNLVQNNAFACGITLASHAAYIKPGQPVPPSGPPLAYGVYNNTILENDSFHNGFGVAGGGAGVGLFAPGPGNRTYANAVTSNRLIGNSMPGVAVHNHYNSNPQGGKSGATNPDVSRNAIVGNYIAGNGPDPDVPTTVSTGISVLGVTPVVDLVVAHNVIEDEEIAVAFNSASTLELHLNDFATRHVGVANMNPGGNVNATEDWWGCSGGPKAQGCAGATGIGVVYAPWLSRPVDGTFGHGHDRFFEFIHDYDCDHDNFGFEHHWGFGGV